MKEVFLGIARVVDREIWKEMMDREIALSSRNIDCSFLSYGITFQAQIKNLCLTLCQDFP
jgi:hypothetical protein